MDRRVTAPALAALAALSLAGAAACGGPRATEGLTYQDVDGAMLDRTTLVVATSRQNVAHHMLGSTLLVDAKGQGKRLDNDGMDTVALAYDGSVVAFSDIGHDYLLGTDRTVRPRDKKAPDTGSGSHLYEGRLISLFNGGFGDGGYRLAIAEGDSSLREDLGWVLTTAQCDDGVWAVVNPDLRTVKPSSRLDIRRVTPAPHRSWSVDSGSGILETFASTCQGDEFVSVGEVTGDDERTQQVLVSVNVTTGRARLVDLDRPVQSGTRTPWFCDAALRGEDLYVVQRPPDAADRAELWRIAPDTGRSQHIAEIQGVDSASDLEFRFQGDLLYILDATEDEPSVLTAIDITNGRTVGRLETEPLLDLVNGPLTSFENSQFVRDFVVLQPPERW